MRGTVFTRRVALIHSLVCIALVGLVLPATLAGDEVELANGQKVKGEVATVTDTEVTLALDAGGAKVTFKLSALAPRDAYRLRARTLAPADADGWIALAEFATTQGLWGEARAAITKAGRADPSRAADVAQRLAACDDGEAQAMLAAAEAASAKADHQRALDLAKLLIARFPASTHATRARDLSRAAIAALDAPVALPNPPAGGPPAPNPPVGNPPVADPAGNKPADPVADPTKLTGKIRQLHDLVRKQEAQGDALATEGLRFDGQGNVSGARRNYEEAVSIYETGLRNLESAPKYANDPAVIALMKLAYDRIVKKVVNTMLNATHVMIREGNYKRGAEYVDIVLRYDPANRNALKLRQEIEEQRITRKASELVNAKGTTCGGGTVK